MIQTLETQLVEVKPIFKDGVFVMPSFQEVLTARQFTDEINSGRLSVKEAYTNFWSYEEDAGLWGLPKDREWRAVLPAWRPILVDITDKIKNEKVEELVSVMVQGYFSYKDTGRDYILTTGDPPKVVTVEQLVSGAYPFRKVQDKEGYNAFFDELLLGVYLLNKKGGDLYSKLLRETEKKIKLKIDSKLESKEYFRLVWAILHAGKYGKIVFGEWFYKAFETHNPIANNKKELILFLRRDLRARKYLTESKIMDLLHRFHHQIKPQGYIAPERLQRAD